MEAFVSHSFLGVISYAIVLLCQWFPSLQGLADLVSEEFLQAGVEEDQGADHSYGGILLFGNGHLEPSFLAGSRNVLPFAVERRLLVYDSTAIHVYHLLRVLVS